MNIVETLRAARKLLVDVGWCTGELARDENGRRALLFSTRCRSFCAIGAVHFVGGCTADAEDLLHAAAEKHAFASAEDFNDYPKHDLQSILDLYDEAIAAAGDK